MNRTTVEIRTSRDVAYRGVPGLVSVIIPFFNANPDYLKEAVESVVAQTCTRWEVILVDDGSRDDAGVKAACTLAASLGKRGQLVTYTEPGNRGLSAARNEGIAHANGEYIAFLDADDVFLPGKLEIEIKTLLRYPKAGMVCSNTQYWYSWDEGQAGRDFSPELGATGIFLPPDPLPRWIRGQSAVPSPCSTMFRRRALVAVAGYEPAFTGLYEDQVVLAKLCLAYPVALIDVVTARYRQHPASMCAGVTTARETAARRTFLNWLRTALEARPNGADARIIEAVRREDWLLDHPIAARAERIIKGRWNAVARIAGSIVGTNPSDRPRIST